MVVRVRALSHVHARGPVQPPRGLAVTIVVPSACVTRCGAAAICKHRQCSGIHSHRRLTAASMILANPNCGVFIIIIIAGCCLCT